MCVNFSEELRVESNHPTSNSVLVYPCRNYLLIGGIIYVNRPIPNSDIQDTFISDINGDVANVNYLLLIYSLFNFCPCFHVLFFDEELRSVSLRLNHSRSSGGFIQAQSSLQ